MFLVKAYVHASKLHFTEKYKNFTVSNNLINLLFA